MKKLLCSCSSIVIFACATAALAGGPQVILVEPCYFNGFSAGLNLSYHLTSFDIDSTMPLSFFDTFSTVTRSDNEPTTSVSVTGGTNDEDVFYGAQLKYGHVFQNRWYLGATGFADGGQTDATEASTINVPYTSVNGSSDTMMGGTLTDEAEIENGLGVAFEPGILLRRNLLAYAKIGVERSKIEVSSTFDGNLQSASTDSTTSRPLIASTSSSENKVGFQVGGGVEYALSHRLSAYAEYTFTNYGSVTSIDSLTPVTGGETPADLTVEGAASLTTSAKAQVSALALGLDYLIPWV